MITKLNEEYLVRGLQECDLDGPYRSWFEDQEVCTYNSHGKFVRTLEYFQRFIQRLNGNEMIVWAICHQSDGHIGNVALQNISLINRNAEFAIILGDKRHWGKKVGQMAGKAIIDHGFRRLNLHRIYCGTASTNIAMRRLAMQLGMREEGVHRQQLYLDGEWTDALHFGILKTDYISAH